MKKYFLSFVLAVTLILPVSAFAASFDVEAVSGSTVVEGTIRLTETKEAVPVTVKIYDEDENLNFFDILYTNEAGVITFSYVNKGESGTYTAYANFGGGYEDMEDTFEFRTLGFWTDLVNRFKDIQQRYMSAENAENKELIAGEMADFIDNHKGDLKLDVKIYAGVLDKTAIHKLMCADNETVSTPEDVKTAFYRGTALAKWNEDNTQTTAKMLFETKIYVSALLKDELPKTDGSYIIDALDSKYRVLILGKAAIKDYTNAKTLMGDIKLYTLTETIKNADSYHIVKELIEAYSKAGIIDVDIEGNNRENDPTKVYKDIMYGEFTSYKSIEDYYNEYRPKTPDGGNGGGSSGGIGSVPNSESVETENEKVPVVIPNTVGTMLFTDLGEYMWAYEGIYELKQRGFVNGISETEFGPAQSITRAEVAAILVRILGYDTNADISGFYDVKKSDWYYPYVATAYKNRIFRGKGNGYFGANDILSREEVAVIVTRVLEDLGKEAPLTTFVYEDHNAISDWAVDGVYCAYATSIMSGKSSEIFAPKDSLMRAEAAVLLYRLIKYAGV